MRHKAVDLTECGLKVTSKADGAIVKRRCAPPTCDRWRRSRDGRVGIVDVDARNRCWAADGLAGWSRRYITNTQRARRSRRAWSVLC